LSFRVEVSDLVSWFLVRGVLCDLAERKTIK